jgi:hypothetical protein
MDQIKKQMDASPYTVAYSPSPSPSPSPTQVRSSPSSEIVQRHIEKFGNQQIASENTQKEAEATKALFKRVNTPVQTPKDIAEKMYRESENADTRSRFAQGPAGFMRNTETLGFRFAMKPIN